MQSARKILPTNQIFNKFAPASFSDSGLDTALPIIVFRLINSRMYSTCQLPEFQIFIIQTQHDTEKFHFQLFLY